MDSALALRLIVDLEKEDLESNPQIVAPDQIKYEHRPTNSQNYPTERMPWML